MYKASISREEIRLLLTEPQLAPSFLMDEIKDQIHENEERPEWYDVTLTEHEDYVEIVAKLNESKKNSYLREQEARKV